MRLINVEKCLEVFRNLDRRDEPKPEPRSILEEYWPPNSTPKYAILSHRWLSKEITFPQFSAEGLEKYAHLDDFQESATKIHNACKTARNSGFNYIWIDSCCVDKSSQTELTESIGSMYRWYQEAAVCLVFLKDVVKKEEVVFSAWFRRGWTLQELLAPNNAIFFNSQWEWLGTREGLSGAISTASKISAVFLSNYTAQRQKPSVATRFSWAANRDTTRPEDRVYSLFGVFDVFIEIRYGEGLNRAFRRLQEEIIRQSPDESIFAWRSDKLSSSGMLARSLECFKDSADIVLQPERQFNKGSFEMTNRGLRVPVPLRIEQREGRSIIDKNSHNVPLNCWIPRPDGLKCVNVTLKLLRGAQEWQRINCGRLEFSDSAKFPFSVGSLRRAIGQVIVPES